MYFSLPTTSPFMTKHWNLPCHEGLTIQLKLIMLKIKHNQGSDTFLTMTLTEYWHVDIFRLGLMRQN